MVLVDVSVYVQSPYHIIEGIEGIYEVHYNGKHEKSHIFQGNLL